MYPSIFPALSIPVSRRLANAPYVLWVATFNTTQILLFALVETFLFPSVHRATKSSPQHSAIEFATSQVLTDFNAGGLLLFLAANLGTGAINLSIKTLEVSNGLAVGVLTVHMAFLAWVAQRLRGWKIDH